jgi:hypothetical protein
VGAKITPGGKLMLLKSGLCAAQEISVSSVRRKTSGPSVLVLGQLDPVMPNHRGAIHVLESIRWISFGSNLQAILNQGLLYISYIGINVGSFKKSFWCHCPKLIQCVVFTQIFLSVLVIRKYALHSSMETFIRKWSFIKLAPGWSSSSP